MKKRKHLGQNGITLVEIIIVIAIMGILASTSVMMIGHLHYANTQKVVKTLDSSLSALQVKTMSKTGDYYMYVYKLDNGYYMRSLPDNLSSFEDTTLSDDGTRLCNNTSKSRRDRSPGNEVTEKGAGGNYIKIAYTKTACFDTANTNVSAIYIDGVPAYTVKLVSDTGKHFIEK